MKQPREESASLPTDGRATVLLCSALAVALVACTQESYPADLWAAQHRTPVNGGGGAVQGVDATSPSDLDAGPSSVGVCLRASGQPLPARLVTMSATNTAGADLIYVSDLFERFKAVCGSCHGPSVDPPGLGMFRLGSPNDLGAGMTGAVLAHIKSEGPSNPADPSHDPMDPMPPLVTPNGSPYSKRPPTDPVRQFAELATTWLAAGSPQSFSPSSARAMDSDGGLEAGLDAAAPSSPYLFSQLVGDTMTNIGSCVPDKGMFASDQAKMVELDTKFAGLTKANPGPGVSAEQAIGLPEHLDDTDLFALDSATLARHGVIAFQPAYPLWSDNAGKLRHVRVPRGASIQFNKDSQEFTIPPNTRFYKTFLKKIVDTDGSYRYRKIETRLIVSRPDQHNADGSTSVAALFGSYQWNSAETDAVLIQTPKRDGHPFADTLLQYTTDEQVAADILASKPRLPLEALLEAGAARHYAIPSSDRCVQCHMGSNSASFVLGFRPVQIKRRAPGEGGTLAEPGQSPPSPDELTQLQRFIDYGIITGINSPDDVLPLERSEGSRTYRNDYELLAQGYMLGNCVHCHNPRGFPSVKSPVLRDVLNFMPGPAGGIFQFPLERYSPRIGRGPGGGEPIPYITPSLMDLPGAGWRTNATDDNPNFAIATTGSTFTKAGHILYAPWRSLIYRNVETPFPYADNLALFPHMPMNTPGYDCRAQQIMSDWMVSIPSKRKNPEKPEFAFSDGTRVFGGDTVDDDPQPFVEVMAGTPAYDAARAAADSRLKIMHTGINPDVSADFTYSAYSTCPDTSDILDPAVLRDPTCHIVPVQDGQPSDVKPLDAVRPPHAHWVNTDLSQAPQPDGSFAVRRPDWPRTVAQQKFDPPVAQCFQPPEEAVATQKAVKQVVALLQDVTGDDATKAFALTPVPFGLWQQKPGCHFPPVPTAGSFAGDKRPLWMGQVANLSPTDPVYMASPGQAVFGMICINCHGPNADGQGRLADNLATMTGGNAIPADFRNGLFGPLSSPGLHRQEAFAPSLLPQGLGPEWTSVSADDRAARYLAWMALGGTEVQIPLAVLTVVADTRVLGIKRSLPQQAISANMLSAAKEICRQILVSDSGRARNFDPSLGWFVGDPTSDYLSNYPLLIDRNGDAELWMRLCSLNNPAPVHTLTAFSSDTDWDPTRVTKAPWTEWSVFAGPIVLDPTGYGPGLVGDESGQVCNNAGTADAEAGAGTCAKSNLYPWCILPPFVATPGSTKAIGDLGAANLYMDTNHLPRCPGWPDGSSYQTGTCAQCWDAARIDKWATRGAINAGLAVFLYLDGLEKDAAQGVPAKPAYDQCELLP